MRKILVVGIVLLAIMGAAIAAPGNGNGNGQGGQDNPGNSGDAPGQQTGDNQGNGQGGNPDNGNNGSNGGDQGNAGGNGNNQGGDSDESDNQGDDSDDSGDGDQDQVDDQEENDQGGDGQGDNAGDSDNGGQDQGNDEDVGGDDQGNNDLVNDLIHDDIPHDEELLRISLRELFHPAPGPTCRLVLEANLTKATITNECAAPTDIGSMVLSQSEHIVIGSTPDGRYILGPGQTYEIDIQAHVGTLRLTGIGGYGEYAACEVSV